MITSELITYIRTQLANGLAREAIFSALSGQGWSPQDIEAALAGASAPTQSAQSIKASSILKARKGWTVGRVFLWIAAAGALGSIAVVGYAMYGIFLDHSAIVTPFCRLITSDIFGAWDLGNDPVKQRAANYNSCTCEISTMISDASHRVPPQEIVKHIFSQAFSESLSGSTCDSTTGPIASSVPGDEAPAGNNASVSEDGVSWLDAYAASNGLGDLSKIQRVSKDRNGAIIMSESFDVDAAGQITDASNHQDVTQDMKGDIAVNDSMLDGLRTSFGSTGWNVDGKWFFADHVNSPDGDQTKFGTDQMIKAGREIVDGQEFLSVETRTHTGGYLDVFLVRISKKDNLTSSIVSLRFPYAGRDYISEKTIGQLAAAYPKADYRDHEFSYVHTGKIRSIAARTSSLSQPPEICSLVSVDEIKSIFGTDTYGKVMHTVGLPPGSCHYSLQSGVFIGIDAYISKGGASEYDKAHLICGEKNAGCDDVAGVGDRAFWSYSKPMDRYNGGTFVFQKGDYYMTLLATYDIFTPQKAAEIAKLVLSRLP